MNPNTYPWSQCDEEPWQSAFSPEEQEMVDSEEEPQYPQGTRLVAERFFWRHVANDLPPIPHSEEVIDAIAELISYGGDLDEIMRKMALM